MRKQSKMSRLCFLVEINILNIELRIPGNFLMQIEVFRDKQHKRELPFSVLGRQVFKYAAGPVGKMELNEHFVLQEHMKYDTRKESFVSDEITIRIVHAHCPDAKPIGETVINLAKILNNQMTKASFDDRLLKCADKKASVSFKVTMNLQGEHESNGIMNASIDRNPLEALVEMHRAPKFLQKNGNSRSRSPKRSASRGSYTKSTFNQSYKAKDSSMSANNIPSEVIKQPFGFEICPKIKKEATHGIYNISSMTKKRSRSPKRTRVNFFEVISTPISKSCDVESITQENFQLKQENSYLKNRIALLNDECESLRVESNSLRFKIEEAPHSQLSFQNSFHTSNKKYLEEEDEEGDNAMRKLPKMAEFSPLSSKDLNEIAKMAEPEFINTERKGDKETPSSNGKAKSCYESKNLQVELDRNEVSQFDSPDSQRIIESLRLELKEVSLRLDVQLDDHLKALVEKDNKIESLEDDKRELEIKLRHTEEKLLALTSQIRSMHESKVSGNSTSLKDSKKHLKDRVKEFEEFAESQAVLDQGCSMELNAKVQELEEENDDLKQEIKEYRTKSEQMAMEIERLKFQKSPVKYPQDNVIELQTLQIQVDNLQKLNKKLGDELAKKESQLITYSKLEESNLDFIGVSEKLKMAILDKENMEKRNNNFKSRIDNLENDRSSLEDEIIKTKKEVNELLSILTHMNDPYVMDKVEIALAKSRI